MSDIENTTTELETKEEVVDTKEVVTEDVQKPTEEEDKQSLFTKIKETILGKKEEVEETKTEDKTRTDLEEDIDDDFSQAAKNAGWSDEDIVQFAEQYNNKELKSLIPFIISEEKEEEKEEEEEVQEEKPKTDDNDLEQVVDKLMKQLDAKYQEKIGQLEERLSKVDEERSIKEQVHYQTTADKLFDRASEKFPVFGKTEELLKFPSGTPQAGQIVPAGEAYEARNAVWKTAIAFNKMGMSWDTALEEALDWYKGKNMEKEIHTKVVKELKGQQKRLSPKRSEQVTEKKYANENEERADVVLTAARKAGVKGI